MNSAPLTRACGPLSAGLNVICRRAVVAAAVVVLIGATAFAQNANLGTVRGRVQNATNGLYLKNARIIVEGTNLEALTDDYGDYMLPEVPAGAATLKIFYTGLEQQTVTVNVPAGQALEQNFRLASARFTQEVKDNVIQLDQFVVAAARETNASAIATSEQRFSPNMKSVIAADAFGDVTEGNVGEFVKFLPGVTVDYTAADVRTISVRGLNNNFTSISVDGARVASAASGSSIRTVELEQLSINNAARVEVNKEPMPSDPADSLGGAINLVSKTAFEQSNTVFNYRAYESVNSEDLNSIIRKTPGPGNRSTYKALPGADFTFIAPLTKTFGFSITGLSSNQFNEQHRSLQTWSTSAATALGVSSVNPAMTAYTMQDGPKVTYRDSLSIKADWKFAPDQILSGTYQYNFYKNFFGNRNINFNTGTTSTPTGGTTVMTFGPTFTYGTSGRGTVTQGTSFRNKNGATNIALLSYNFKGRVWEVSAGANWSQSMGVYKDLANGYWNAVNTSLQSVSRVLYDGITYPRPGVISVLNSSAAAVDYTTLSNYRITSMRTSPLKAKDIVSGYQGSVKRDLDFLPFPASLKLGGEIREQYRDIRRNQADYNFVGADGTANTADDVATPYLDTNYIGQDPYWGFNPLQWASPFALGSLYQTNPNYFAQTLTQQTSALKFQMANSQKIRETVSAGYLEAEAKLFHNRLRIVTGVRFEQTDDDAAGALKNPRGVFDANGVRLAPAGSVQEVLLTYTERGYHATKTYSDYYPSFHATYNITDNLLARFAYARTLGRPDFGNILPSVRLNDTNAADNTDGLGTIPAYTAIITNPDLKPWTGDNYDLSLEYYPQTGGSFTVGVFRKDLADYFATVSHTLTQADLATYDIDPTYLTSTWLNSNPAITIQQTINGGAARILGAEMSLDQPLTFLPWVGRYLNLKANATLLHLQGDSGSQMQNFIPKTGNLGLVFSKTPVIVRVTWNFRGQEKQSQTTAVPAVVTWYAARTYLDMDAEYQLSKRLSLFLEGRNITNVPQNQLVYSSTNPLYARFNRAEEYGIQWAIGVKGSF